MESILLSDSASLTFGVTCIGLGTFSIILNSMYRNKLGITLSALGISGGTLILLSHAV